MRRAPGLLVVLVAAACSHAPRELVDARYAYLNARPSADLTAARFALDRAGHEYELNGDTERARDLAYIAQRKIDVANSNARLLDDKRALNRLNAEAAKLKARQKREVEEQAAALPPVPPPPLPPPPPPPEVEVPLETLAPFAQVREDPVGTVIVVPASLIFSAGDAELTDGAKQRLDDIAAVVRSRRGRVDVGVHTDNLGARLENEALSARRARAVVDYLVERGVGAERLQAHGLGDRQPVRDNATPENRAANRRLEIVLRREPVSRAPPGELP
jgi:outer membrane protein OmpA-like peptidoglycan-associated protein